MIVCDGNTLHYCEKLKRSGVVQARFASDPSILIMVSYEIEQQEDGTKEFLMWLSEEDMVNVVM